MNKEENALNLALSKKVVIPVKLDRIEDYFILSSEELLVVSQCGSIKVL